MAREELRECAGCGKVFARVDLGPKSVGFKVRRWDTREIAGRAGVGYRGNGSRAGAVPEWKACQMEAFALHCKTCGGDVAPPPDVPVWKQARSAWETWATEPGGAEWIQMAPKSVKRQLGLCK